MFGKYGFKYPFMDAETEISGSEINSAANEGELAELQTEIQTDSSDNPPEGQGQEVAKTEPVEDITQTQAFARRLKEERQKAIDAEYDRLYGSEYGIHSKAEYDAYIERQKLIEEGKDPEVYELKKEVEAFKRERTLIEQDTSLSNDPQLGDLYKQWKEEVKQTSDQFGVDYNTAFTLLCRNKLPSVIGEYKQKLEVTQANKKNAASSTGALTGNGDVPNDFIAKDTFEMNRNNMKWVSDNLERLKQSMKKW